MELSIVIIEYNSVADIRTAVAAFNEHCLEEIDFEIIVSSNSCYPSEKQKELQREFPDVHWLFNEKNGGFAYGMNQGLKAAKGDFLLISNPDVRLKTPLRPGLTYLKAHPEIGVLGAQIRDSQGHLQDSCRNFMWPGEMIMRQLIRLFRSKDVLLNKSFDYTKIQLVDWIIGAFILVKREVYEKVGGMDEGYFLYVEDMDWNYRIHQAGYQIVYNPDVRIEYKGDRKSTRTLFHDKHLISYYGMEHLKSYCRFLRKFYFK